MRDAGHYGRTGMLLLLALCMVFIGCNNPVDEKKVDRLMTDKPVSVRWNPSEKGKIESFQADVEVYMMNNRKDTEAELQMKYRLATKVVDGARYTRIDMDPQSYQGQARISVISSDNETIFFDPDTETIVYRLANETSPLAKDLSFLQIETGFSRLDLAAIRQEANRLSLKMEENDSERMLVLDLPTKLLGGFSDRRLSTKVVFDTNEEVLQLVETVDYMEDDGSTIRTTIQPMYQEVDGQPVKVGMITVVDTQIPMTIEGDWSEVPVYNAPEDIPIISEQEFKRLQADGMIHESIGVTFGDPASLNHIDTMVELYSEIQINETPDSTFRLLLEGGR